MRLVLDEYKITKSKLPPYTMATNLYKRVNYTMNNLASELDIDLLIKLFVDPDLRFDTNLQDDINMLLFNEQIFHFVYLKSERSREVRAIHLITEHKGSNYIFTIKLNVNKPDPKILGDLSLDSVTYWVDCDLDMSRVNYTNLIAMSSEPYIVNSGNYIF